MNVLRIGLIGVSGFGARHYADLLREVGAGRAVAAAACVVNPAEVPERVSALRERGCRIYGDAAAMFAAEAGRLDLVMIPTGIATHRGFTEQALQAGAHVLVEKPAAATVADVEAMLAAEAASGKRVFVGFQHRYDPLTLVLQRALQAGAVGDVQAVVARGSWPRGLRYYGRNAWAGALEADGVKVNDAPFNNAFAHDVLTALWFASAVAGRAAEPREVRAELYRLNDIGSCDSAFLEVRTDAAPVYLAFTHVGEVPREPEVVVTGTRGTLHWTHDGARLEAVGAVAQTFTCLELEALREAMFTRIWQDLRGIAGEGARCPLSLARAQTQVAEAALAAPIRSVPRSEARLEEDEPGDPRWIWPEVDARVQGWGPAAAAKLPPATGQH